jgi:hypothetical protein
MIISPGGRPWLLAYVDRKSGPNRVPLVQADVAGVAFEVWSGGATPDASGAFDKTTTVFDELQSGDVWPNETWNFEAQFPAGVFDDGGESLSVVVRFELIDGDRIVYEEAIGTRDTPGF